MRGGHSAASGHPRRGRHRQGGAADAMPRLPAVDLCPTSEKENSPEMTGAAAAMGKQGVPVPADGTTALDEDQAPVGAQSAPTALLHPWEAAVAPRLSRSMRLDTAPPASSDNA